MRAMKTSVTLSCTPKTRPQADSRTARQIDEWWIEEWRIEERRTEERR